MATINRATLARVKALDLIATWVFVLGGVLVIGSVILILFLIVSVTFPLFLGADRELRIDRPMPASLARENILGIGVDLVILDKKSGGDALNGYTLADNGVFTFLEFDDEFGGSEHAENGLGSMRLVGSEQAKPPTAGTEQRIVAFERHAGSRYTLLWPDGSASLVQTRLTAEFDDLGRRSTVHGLKLLGNADPIAGKQVRLAVMRGSSEKGLACARLLADNTISVIRESVGTAGLFGEPETERHRLTISDGLPGKVTAMTMNHAGNTLYVGTDNGCLARWKISSDGRVTLHDVTTAFSDKRAITSLAMVFGDVSLAVGDETGHLATYMEVRTEDARQLKRIHELSKHPGAVVQIFPSQRNKSLLSLDTEGDAQLDYVTSEKHLLTLGKEHPLRQVGYSERGNAVIGRDDENRLVVWQIRSPHPEISLSTLFGKVWYDNHDKPKYIWQSSGTDEPKFSLVPIVFGTLKATLYAMLFAVPVALFAAMYTSHFTTPTFKRVIKPVVEVMAAVPTVVVGFLILLWLAPLMNNWIVALFVSGLSIPLCFAVFMTIWQGLRKWDFFKHVENGYEFIVLIPVVIVGGLIAIWLRDPVANWLFDGNFQQWLYDNTLNSYVQLNALVVALGLGYAVIPIIFSMSEDSLSSIPSELNAASLALGASRWQTIWRVILPSASPGIFAAVMIGFGRAVGETMIVFMAAGNTPILDWSPFNGFRTLSANIAVEISEAPRDGTLYRVLFLCAVILFAMTFLLNTAAELVRTRLRKKYGRL